MQADALCWGVGHHAVDLGRDQRAHERGLGLEHTQQVDVARQVQTHLLAVADKVYAMGLGEVAVQVGRELLELALVCADEDITVLEAILLGLGIELHTVAHVLHGDIGVAPMEENHRIDEQGQQEVDEHTADHDQQALPGRLRTELPGLLGLFHLLGVETLVNHTGNLTVAAQRKPAHTVLRVAVLGLELKQAAVPFPYAGVEEEIEFVDAYTKEFGEEEVAALVEQHQKSDCKHELQQTYQKNIHNLFTLFTNLPFYFFTFLPFYFFISSAAMRRASASVAI